jgi:glutamate-1-semialdehyde aminotransferase
MSKYVRKRSQELQRRANDVIAHGALTNSKRPASFVEGVYPTHFRDGRDAYLTDVDGNGYVDYIGGLGAHHFGYRHPEITEAVRKQVQDFGSIFSFASDLEVEVAEGFRDRFPFLQRLRFLKTASEACSAAIRIARAFTKKACVLSEGYHGWHDDFVSLTPPAEGVPARYWMETLPTKEPILYEQLAAVIVEPVIVDAGPDRIRWLHELRAETKKRDVLLIFDETITGIRYPGLSVAKATGIDPDIAIMGKAIGGGYPLALVGGRADVMSCDYFVSSTYLPPTARSSRACSSLSPPHCCAPCSKSAGDARTPSGSSPHLAGSNSTTALRSRDGRSSSSRT